jgi:hypothetical protein
MADRNIRGRNAKRHPGCAPCNRGLGDLNAPVASRRGEAVALWPGASAPALGAIMLLSTNFALSGNLA